MYVPAHNQVKDRAEILGFMHAHSFAALITHGESGLRATHLPVLVREEAGDLRVLGHMAKANPQWKDFAPDREVSLLFSGPHAYVSPRHYERAESVPTWNYAAVHVYGAARLIESPEGKYGLLEQLIAQEDPEYLAQFRALRPEYVGGRLSAIVAFTIEVKRLEARFKLSQDRLQSERERIIAALTASGDSAAVETAQLMRGREPGA